MPVKSVRAEVHLKTPSVVIHTVMTATVRMQSEEQRETLRITHDFVTVTCDFDFRLCHYTMQQKVTKQITFL